MIVVNLFSKLFIKNYEDINSPSVRASYGNLSGIMGIILNLCLFIAKLTAGVLTSSISVIADAFNNLSDAGSSLVTFFGFRLANRPADKEHPFGHGRYEYLTGLIISFLILLVGIELLKSSAEKIFNPEAITSMNMLSVIILIASIAVKLWMFYFNKILSKKINSSALKATATDSLTDSIATSIVLIGLVFSQVTTLNIDGYLGVAVAIFIFIAGIKTLKESISPLLGTPPEKEFVDDIKRTVLEDDMIVGLHDLIVHDYGPGRCIISLHAEISDQEDLLKAHDKIDLIEKELEIKFNCLATIHMDPIASDDEYTFSLKGKVVSRLLTINKDFSVHDFRIVQGDTHTNVIFDLVVPYECKEKNETILRNVTEAIKSIDQKLVPVVYIEKPYTE